MSAGPTRTEGRRVLLLGGTSEIGLAIVHELQSRSPRDVMLMARDSDATGRAAAALADAGCPRVLTAGLDALDLDSHEHAVERAYADLGGTDIAILAVGVLGDRGGLPADIRRATAVLELNVVAAGSLLMHAAERMRQGGGGTIVVLSSVAAERPRKANVVYGASKAGLDSLAQGLADALHGEGVRVIVVRPGFVHTKMTAGLEPAPLASTPQAVARVVAGAIDGGSDTVWAPAALRWVMLVLRLLPRRLFRRIGT
jgi:decaprenylphospho-beta-D-erythro-pentofuranosid-2-ulose 2-reductase